MNFSVYMLHSSKINRFYMGYTEDFSKRLAFHNSPNNGIWSKRGQPWTLFLIIDDLTKTQAIKLEKHLKKIKSRNYLTLLKEDQLLLEDLKKRFS